MKSSLLIALLFTGLLAHAGLKPITDVYECDNLTSGDYFHLIVEIDVDDSRESFIETSAGRQEIETSSYRLVRLGSGGEWQMILNGRADEIACRYDASRSTNE